MLNTTTVPMPDENDNPKPCPCCGWCPTCGRRDAAPYVPTYPPYQPGPIWIAPYNPWRGPWWIGGPWTAHGDSGTNASGSITATAATTGTTWVVRQS